MQGAETGKGQLYHLLSENLLNSGKAHEAEKWIQSKGVNQFQPDANLEARLYLRTGRFTAAKTVLLQKKKS